MKRAAVLALVACHAAHPPALLPVTATAHLDGAAADQLVEVGDVTYVLGRDRLAIARGDQVIAAVPLVGGHAWTTAASIAALDGDGRWVVATRDDGTLWRIRLDGELEPIAERFGLGGERITAIAGAGATTAVAFAHGVAVTTDGVHLARYPTTGALAVARGRLAIATEHAVELWDLVAGTSQRFELANARPLFVDPDSPSPRLVVQMPEGLWLERAGTLHALAPARAVAAAGPRLWAVRGGTLAVLAGDTLVATGARTEDDARLFGSPSGDVWLARAALQRYSLEHAADPRWQAEVAPIFQRVCAHCHLPGGDADFDLSTAAAWQQARDAITERVLVDRTMPPAGTTLTDADRAALARWLSR